VAWAKRETIKGRLTKDEMKRQIDSTKSETLERSLKGFRATFRFRRGPKPQVNREDYATLVTTAEFLRPAILILLNQLDSTTHTLREILTYLQKDHPEACKFLMRHQTSFEKCLTDQKLLARAHKPSARSGLLAYAMAGCEYRLAFSTSIERVREAKRTLKYHS
jgi:hypothetical protein